MNLLDISDSCKALGGIGESTLRRWISEGKVSVVRVGRRVMIRPEDLERLVDQQAKNISGLGNGQNFMEQKKQNEKISIKSQG